MLTFADGSGAAGLCQAVSLAHRAAEAHVHEALRGSWKRGSTWQQDSRATSQQRANFLEHQPGRVNTEQIRRNDLKKTKKHYLILMYDY